MAYALLAWTNYVKSASITATTQQTALPASNIAGDSGSPSQAWQSTTSASTQVLTIVPNASGQSWDVCGLFRTNLTSAASIVWTLYQNPSTVLWTATTSGPVPSYGQVVALPPTGTIADYLTVAISDFGNPDGFLSVATAFAGPSFQPIGSISFESTTGRDATVAETVARGGEEFPVLQFQRRRWNVVLDSLRNAEVWSSVDALAAYSAAGSNVLFIPNMTSLYIQQEALFGRLKPASDFAYPYSAADRRKWSATITERL